MTTRTVIVRSGLIYKRRIQTPSSSGYIPRYAGAIGEAGGKKTAFRHVRRRYGEYRKLCIFKEHWGETLCENHDNWGFSFTPACELPNTSGPGWSQVTALENGILSMLITGNNPSTLGKSQPFVTQDADFAPKEIKIKISASAVSDDIGWIAYVFLRLSFGVSGYKRFFFAISSWDVNQWDGPTVSVNIGDNGGEEQTIIIADHFEIPENDSLTNLDLLISAGEHYVSSASFAWDYIEIKGKCIPW